MTNHYIREIVSSLKRAGKTVKKTTRVTYLLCEDRCELIVIKNQRRPSGVLMQTQQVFNY